MSSPTLPPMRHRPWAVLPLLAAGVLVLHVAVCQGLAQAGAAQRAAPPEAPGVQVRVVTPPPEAAEPPPRPAVRPAPAPLPRRAIAPQPAPAQEPAVVPHEEPALVAAALPASTQATPSAAASVPETVPVYRTVVPAAVTLSYDMRRGALSGTGELQWRPSAEGYEARLEGRVAGFSILTWVSQGGFDAAGLAPVRFTDQRRGRDVQAANFQRQAGKISFSGPSIEYPLLRGAQDRLSWMIQAAAIGAADPKRLAVGARVSMFVAGARGDAEVWAFRVMGEEDVSTGETTVRTVKLLREPRKPHDTRVEVWLAPSLNYLPARARLTSEGSFLELQLQSVPPAS